MHLCNEPVALFHWIYQLGKTVGQFNAGDIQFKPLGNTIITCFFSGQRTQFCRIIVKEYRGIMTQIRFNPCHQYFIKHILFKRFLHGDVCIPSKGFGHCQPRP